MDLFYSTMRAILRPVLARGFTWVISGEEHIPADGPVVLAANHISYLDGLCLSYVADRQGRRIRFLVKASVFDVPVVGFVLRGVGDIPVGRGRNSPPGAALEAALAALAAGECVGIFPEGRISTDFEPLEAHTGVARLAGAAGVPVVPVGLWGSHRLLTRGRRPRPRWGVPEAVAVGPPLAVGRDEDPHEATDRIMAAICAQVSEARRQYPERPAGSSPAWWDREPDTAQVRTCRNLTETDEGWPAPSR